MHKVRFGPFGFVPNRMAFLKILFESTYSIARSPQFMCTRVCATYKYADLVDIIIILIDIEMAIRYHLRVKFMTSFFYRECVRCIK